MDTLIMYGAISAAIKTIIDWAKKYVPSTNIVWEPPVAVVLGIILCWLFDANIMVYFSDATGAKYYVGFVLTGLLIGTGANGIDNLVEFLKGKVSK